MGQMSKRWLLASMLGIVTMATSQQIQPAPAQDFCVETQIYVGDKKEPSSNNITRFKGPIVWDFAGDGSEVVMLDTARGRFAILDLKRKVRTEVTTAELLQFTQQLREWAQGQDDPLLKFCAAPRLEKVTAASPKSLKFSSELLTYEIEAQQPASPQQATRYREFSDWYARVNSMFRPGSLPPFPRLVVNEQLGRDKMVPTRVKLTLAPQRSHGNKAVVVRSQQNFVDGLRQSDLKAIDRAANDLVALRAVSLPEYRGETANR